MQSYCACLVVLRDRGRLEQWSVTLTLNGAFRCARVIFESAVAYEEYSALVRAAGEFLAESALASAVELWTRATAIADRCASLTTDDVDEAVAYFCGDISTERERSTALSLVTSIRV
ncbi:hypothetical protein [Tahibacter amnicola]|uniref:Uncharacterized protein n=1 Tax=Tahibacter amnicola TaxID=2976241 RepID=A0ABY6BBV2_9GAMM|nr:hypothetical protein [Tahibacter amnicola]UXI67042.1 hypothetical protein N4264_20155 [Tahibacter amnicola]